MEIGKMEKAAINISILILTQYTPPSSRCLQNLKTLSQSAPEKSVKAFFVGERTSSPKGNDRSPENKHFYIVLK